MRRSLRESLLIALEDTNAIENEVFRIRKERRWPAEIGRTECEIGLARAALNGRLGDQQKCFAFARKVVSQVREVHDEGIRDQEKLNNAIEYYVAGRKILAAIQGLELLIMRDRVAGNAFGWNLDQLFNLTGPLESATEDALRKANEAVDEAPRAKRGRNNFPAIKIVAMIARENFQFFGKWPTKGRRGAESDKPSKAKPLSYKPLTPFHEMCAAVDGYLRANGRLTSLSDVARKKGIELARLQEKT